MPSDQTRLESWKEIAAYLNREVRTARRWEKERGLPVHRVPGKRSVVYALVPEIDAWLKVKPPNGSNGSGLVDVNLPPPRSRARSAPWLATAGAVLLATALLLGLTAQRLAVPRLARRVRITNDGRLKGDVLGGGNSLFFASLTTLNRLSQAGGEATSVPLPWTTFALLDVSRDGSQSLVICNDSEGPGRPLWAVPSTGGATKRLANLFGDMAAWSPDGSKLAFAVGRDLYLSDADGKHSRRFVGLPFEGPGVIRWCPDGSA